MKARQMNEVVSTSAVFEIAPGLVFTLGSLLIVGFYHLYGHENILHIGRY